MRNMKAQSLTVTITTKESMAGLHSQFQNLNAKINQMSLTDRNFNP